MKVKELKKGLKFKPYIDEYVWVDGRIYSEKRVYILQQNLTDLGFKPKLVEIKASVSFHDADGIRNQEIGCEYEKNTYIYNGNKNIIAIIEIEDSNEWDNPLVTIYTNASVDFVLSEVFEVIDGLKSKITHRNKQIKRLRSAL